MRIPSVVAYAVLLLALVGVWRYTSIGVDRTPEPVACAKAPCGPPRGVDLVRAAASPRHLLAPVVLEGHRLLFLVDTGAATSVLSHKSAQALGLSQRARPVLGALNASFQLQHVLPVTSLVLGESAYADFDILIVDIAGIRAGLGRDVAGVLGANVLGLQPFEIDFRSATLRLGRSDADFASTRGPLETESRQSVEELSGGWFVRASADGREGFFLIDSGADATQVGSALAAYSVRITAEEGQSFDATGSRTELVRGLELDSLAVGEVVRRNVRVNVADPSLLGADFFDDMLLRIDPGRSELILRTRAAGEVHRNPSPPRIGFRVGPTPGKRR